MPQLLHLGFSPCPNDTFIFDALVNGALKQNDFRFQVHLHDVQELNEAARAGKFHVSKISYGVWPQLRSTHRLLEAGGALGFGVGPLLVAKRPIDLARVPELTIAIPGINTTAHLLFSMAFPKALQKKFMVFHEIETALLNGEVDAGVIIHEGRFTYKEKGLHHVLDLGAYWEEQLNCPIPLGGIVVRNDMPETIDELLNNYIQKSIELGWENFPLLSDYIRSHAQEMSEDVMRQHIQLYVNEYSLSLGDKGHKAIEVLINVYEKMHQAPSSLSATL